MRWTLTSLCVVVACTAAMAPAVSNAAGLGPFVEASGGLAVPTLQETGGSATLNPGSVLAVTAGISATRRLAVEVSSVLTASGSVTESGGGLTKEWSMTSTTLGIRGQLAEPVPDLIFGVAAGLGVTRLEIGVADAAIADQRAASFTYYLAGRCTYVVVGGLYAGADLRVLLTPTWRDVDAENVELDTFSMVPLLASAALGYQFDLF